jgi:hypothetical protein
MWACVIPSQSPIYNRIWQRNQIRASDRIQAFELLVDGLSQRERVELLPQRLQGRDLSRVGREEAATLT